MEVTTMKKYMHSGFQLGFLNLIFKIKKIKFIGVTLVNKTI